MIPKSRNKSALLVSIGLVFTLFLSLTQPAAAQAVVYGDTVPEGAVIEQNLILAGYNVTIDGTVNGDVMAFGTRVSVNGTINGSLVTAAEYVNINGQVNGSVYAAALLLNMGSTADVTRDLSFLGVQLNLQQSSLISRDLYTLSLLSASFAGQVGRNTFAEIGPSAILQFIFDLAGWPLPNWLGSGSLPPALVAKDLPFMPSTLISSSPLVFRGAGLFVLSPSMLSPSGRNPSYLLAPVSAADPVRWEDWGMDLLRNLAALLFVGFMIAWLFPKVLTGSSERLRAAPWPAVGWGLVVYLVGWFLFGLLFTLILALTIFFFTISFINVGFVVGGVSLAGLGLAFALFCLSIFYVSKIVCAVLFGRLIFGLVSKKAAAGRLLPLLFGLILYALAASVPYLGFVISTLATFFGLGAMWLALRPVKQLPIRESVAEEAPAALPAAEQPELDSPLGLEHEPVAALPEERIEPDLPEELPRLETPAPAKLVRKRKPAEKIDA
jgi:cytoskeletal protein CcmA (bactofilin family)